MTRKVFGIDDRLERSKQHVRPDIAGNEIDLVGFDELLGLLFADFRLEAIILIDHFDRQAAHFAAHMIECELERITHVLADDGNRTAKCADEADLDGFLLGHGRTRCEQQRGARGQKCFTHMTSSPRAFGPYCLW